jgi:hypothetical protein
MWNDPVPDASEFAREYRSIARGLAGAQPASAPTPPLDNGVDRFFGGIVPYQADIPHAMRHDIEGFLGRARSSGFLPQPGGPGHDELAALLTDLFARHQHDGKVQFHYITRLYVGRLR